FLLLLFFSFLPFFSPTNSTSFPLFPPAGNRGAASSPASTSSLLPHHLFLSFSSSCSCHRRSRSSSFPFSSSSPL
ncbi:unnamed protein product, partial [Musa hybrid cultivar]